MALIEFYVVLLIALSLWVSGRRRAYVKNRRGFNLRREILLNAFFLYTLAVVYVAFFPDSGY